MKERNTQENVSHVIKLCFVSASERVSLPLFPPPPPQGTSRWSMAGIASSVVFANESKTNIKNISVKYWM